MEQNNLVVTPDGKTWDEVTRDVSYIGNQDVALRATTASAAGVGTNNTHRYNELRGKKEDVDCGNKNWVCGYDRWICLKNGLYRVEWWTTIGGAGKAGNIQNIKINGSGTPIAKWWGQGDTDTELSRTTVTAYFKRGDYIQNIGGWYGSELHSNYHIHRM